MDSRNWIKRIIYYQEKKPYNFYTILIFTLFVGIARSLEEVMLAGRLYKNIHILNNFIFYFLMAFSFTLVLQIITRHEWQKIIFAVLIGVFLGLFPPIIDLFVYGLGQFSYAYVMGIPSIGQLLLFDSLHGFPVGEGIVLWSTIIFSCYYIYLKTQNIRKCIYGALLVYFVMLLSGYIIPSLSFWLYKKLFLSKMEMLSFTQLSFAILCYLLINPVIAKNLFVRCLHCIPFVLLTFLGAVLSGTISTTTIMTAGVVFYAGMITIVQNDYFDRNEDMIAGRHTTICSHDLIFFNTTYLMLVFILYNSGALVFLPLLLLFIVSILYNYDFYRAKKFFPANYKIEGIWGLSSFLAGILSQRSAQFTPEIVIYCFLVFGGWSLVSTFKDYKDIEADKAVGNQTGYIMLMKAGLSLERAHKIVCSMISACFLVPVVWLFFQHIPLFVPILFPVLTLPQVFVSLRMPPSSKMVKNMLLATSFYLFVLLIILIFFYQMPGTAPLR